MRTGTPLRLIPVGLAGVLALALVVGFLALRGSAAGTQAAGDPPLVIATVSVGSMPSGVAVNPNTNLIYVTNYSDNSVSVIDGAKNTVVATVGGVGNIFSIGVAVNPNTNLIYVTNGGGSPNVYVINGANNAVVATLQAGDMDNSFGVAVNPKTNLIYVVDPDSSYVYVIDGAPGSPTMNTVVATAPGGGSTSVAVNPNTNRIYVPGACGGSVCVIDGASNTVVATVPVGSNPQGVAVNPNTNRIYMTNDYTSPNVSVIDGTNNNVVATVAVAGGGVAVNPNTNRIYVAGGNNVSVIDGASNTVVATVPVGTHPVGVAVNPNTDRIYVTNQTDGTVSVIQDPYTPAGSNVIVPLNGGLGSIGGMQTTFSSVTQSGDTSVDLLSSGPLPPTGYHVLGVAGQPAYYDITTTATFSGLVTVCIAYNPTHLIIPESALVLMHYVGAKFVPITTSVDTVNHVICGQTTSLSPFIVAQPVTVVGGIAEAPDTTVAPSSSSAPPYADFAGIAAAGVVVVAAGGWFMRRRRAR